MRPAQYSGQPKTASIFYDECSKGHYIETHVRPKDGPTILDVDRSLSTSQGVPQGSKYPIFEVFDPGNHGRYGFFVFLLSVFSAWHEALREPEERQTF